MSTNLSHLPVEERERRILDENTALKQVIKSNIFPIISIDFISLQENNHLKARMNEVRLSWILLSFS